MNFDRETLGKKKPCADTNNIIYRLKGYALPTEATSARGKRRKERKARGISASEYQKSLRKE